VYFSDESKLIGKKCGKMFIRKQKNLPYTDKMMNKKKKFDGGISVMVWGMIGPSGGLKFCEIKGRMDSESYI
jgi:hypothetical protein